jgi:hypothetical protein
MSLKAPLCALALLLTSACSLPPRIDSPRVKNVQVSLVDAVQMDVAGSYPGAAFASFSLIQGALAGETTIRSVFYVPVQFGSSSSIPIDELAATVQPLATLPTDRMKSEGLTVTPATTRLARLGTFLAKDKEGEAIVGAGLLDTKTRDTIFLAYFSEKSEVRGTVSMEGIEIKVDLRVPKAGLHWLRIVKSTPTIWRMEVASEDVPISFVTSAR